MNARTRALLEDAFLTIGEVAALLGVSVAAAMKQSERKRWDYVLKGRVKLYYRGDFDPKPPPQSPTSSG